MADAPSDSGLTKTQRLLSLILIAMLPITYIPLEVVPVFISTAPVVLALLICLKISLGHPRLKFDLVAAGLVAFACFEVFRLVLLAPVIGESGNWSLALTDATQLVAATFLYCMVRSRISHSVVVTGVAFGAMVTMILVVAQVVQGVGTLQGLGYEEPTFTFHTGQGTFMRPFGGFASPVTLGCYCAMVIAFLAFQKAFVRRRVWVGGLMSSSICLVLSQSRAAWIAVAISLVAAAWMLYGRRTNRWIDHSVVYGVPLLGIALLSYVVAPSLLSSVVDRLLTVFDMDFSSNQGRLLLWGETFAALGESPLVGFGAIDFKTVVSVNLPLQFQDLGHPHNTYLQVAYRYGLVGLLLLVMFLYNAATKLAHGLSAGATTASRSALGGNMAALVAFLFCSCFEQLWTGFGFFLLLATLIAVHRGDQEVSSPSDLPDWRLEPASASSGLVKRSHD